MATELQVTSHAAEVLAGLQSTCNRAPERCGMQMEGYAQDLCPVDTGALRNSITHRVVDGEKAVYVGTNQEYAPYCNWHRTSEKVTVKPFLLQSMNISI